LPVDGNDWLIADHPSVMTGWQGSHLAGPGVNLGAVLHHDMHPAGYLILLMRSHTQVGARHRLDMLGPLPTRLHSDSPDLGTAGQIQQLQAPLFTLTDFVRLVEKEMLQRLRHPKPPPFVLRRRIVRFALFHGQYRQLPIDEMTITRPTRLQDLPIRHPGPNAFNHEGLDKRTAARHECAVPTVFSGPRYRDYDGRNAVSFDESPLRISSSDAFGLPEFTVSFGVVEALDQEELPALINRADAALFQAKREGRDRVVVQDGSGNVVAARSERTGLPDSHRMHLHDNENEPAGFHSEEAITFDEPPA
jgi:hypothetical protein